MVPPSGSHVYGVAAMTGQDPAARLQRLIEERDAARAQAEESRRRLAALQSTTVAVAGARSAAAAIDAVLGMGLQAVGAEAGYVATVDRPAGVARVIAAVGPTVGESQLPIEASLEPTTPIGRTVRTGEPLFLRPAEGTDLGIPLLPVRGWPWPHGSLAVLPLTSDEGVAGVLVLAFARPQPFENPVMGLSALSNLAAAALVRVHLLAEEERSRAEVASVAERNAFLAEATALVSAPLDEQTVLERLARLCVPRLGDWCSITRPRGEVLERVIVHHHDASKRELTRTLERSILPMSSDTPVSRTFRTGAPQLLADLGAAMAVDPNFGPEQRRVFEQLGDAAGITVPIGPASRPVGVLAFAVAPGRTISDDDVSLAVEIALRAGIAVTHAENFARERDTAALLQRAILPATLPGVPGVELAAAYRPADVARTIGGDWFDVCAVDDRRIAVSVGDVAGHGMAAASSMGQLRNALRAYLFEGRSPGEALRLVNRMLAADPDQHYATAVAAVLDLATGKLRTASAGHPPPIVASPGADPVLIQEPRGPMLGVLPDAEYPEDERALSAGDSLLLYTDGLVERRRRALDDTIADLARVVRQRPPAPGSAQVWCDNLLRDQSRESDHDDDSCVLVVRAGPDFPVVEAVPVARKVFGRPVATLDLEPQVGAARTARRWLAEVLGERQRLSELQLCLSELVTNAVLHARTPLTVSVQERSGWVRVTVRDGSPAMPQRQHRPLTAPSGRGLHLLDALTSRWDAERVGSGKVVWFEVAS